MSNDDLLSEPNLKPSTSTVCYFSINMFCIFRCLIRVKIEHIAVILSFQYFLIRTRPQSLETPLSDKRRQRDRGKR